MTCKARKQQNKLDRERMQPVPGALKKRDKELSKKQHKKERQLIQGLEQQGVYAPNQNNTDPKAWDAYLARIGLRTQKPCSIISKRRQELQRRKFQSLS